MLVNLKTILEIADAKSKMDENASLYGADFITFDGVHPNITGAKIISNEWLKEFNKIK